MEKKKEEKEEFYHFFSNSSMSLMTTTTTTMTMMRLTMMLVDCFFFCYCCYYSYCYYSYDDCLGSTRNTTHSLPSSSCPTTDETGEKRILFGVSPIVDTNLHTLHTPRVYNIRVTIR